MRRCMKCGGRLRRVHRTLLERVSYLAIFACRECDLEHYEPRRFRLHFGPVARCPKCGTYRIVRLRGLDHIDPMHTGFWNLLERIAGGRLYHCCFCRIQFWDRRRLAAEVTPQTVVGEPEPAASNGESDARA